MSLDKLRFGTAGIPITAPKRDTINGIAFVRELGLECMELEFVRSINITIDRTKEIAETAKKNDVVLTCHAPYYINLNSKEKPKIYASIKRIIDSAKILDACDGYSVCFHPAYYGGMEKEKTYETVLENIKKIVKHAQDLGLKIWIRPETTGKPSAFGDYEECVKLAEEVEQVLPCIDFSHLHARTNGGFNTFEEITKVLNYVEKKLGKNALNNMHIHYNGINYTEKGERNHLNLKESDANYKEVLKAWKEYNIKGCVISEAPNIEQDALLMQKTYGN